MSEYICDFGDKSSAFVGLAMAEATAHGAELREGIVRCRDCKHYSKHEWVIVTDVSDVCHFWHGEPTKVAPDGFCAWGERRDPEWLMCKCGEEMETEGVCPSCGRTVRE